MRDKHVHLPRSDDMELFEKWMFLSLGDVSKKKSETSVNLLCDMSRVSKFGSKNEEGDTV